VSGWRERSRRCLRCSSGTISLTARCQERIQLGVFRETSSLSGRSSGRSPHRRRSCCFCPSLARDAHRLRPGAERPLRQRRGRRFAGLVLTRASHAGPKHGFGRRPVRPDGRKFGRRTGPRVSLIRRKPFIRSGTDPVRRKRTGRLHALRSNAEPARDGRSRRSRRGGGLSARDHGPAWKHAAERGIGNRWTIGHDNHNPDASQRPGIPPAP
jgi:hypothetical protein